jgi:hypothetical protein
MGGAIPPLPNTPSWRGAWLKDRQNFTFTFTRKDAKKKCNHFKKIYHDISVTVF